MIYGRPSHPITPIKRIDEPNHTIPLSLPGSNDQLNRNNSNPSEVIRDTFIEGINRLSSHKKERDRLLKKKPKVMDAFAELSD